MHSRLLSALVLSRSPFEYNSDADLLEIIVLFFLTDRDISVVKINTNV